jgi:phosphoglycerol transferase MdoB-like AlkP superfamily enzyme
MKEYLNQIGNVLYRLLVLLLLFSISRLFFFYANYPQFSHNSITELIKIFVVGIRFDATAVIEINLIFFLLYALPFGFAQNKNYLRAVNLILIIVNALVLLLNFTDAEYFKYTAKRSTADLFGFIFMSNDTITLLPQFLKDFWYVPIAWLLTVALGIYLLRKLPFKQTTGTTASIKFFIRASLVLILMLGSLFAFARGLGLKPVRIITAARYTSSQNIPLLLNTPFCIIHTLNEKEKEFKPYFPENEVSRLYNPEQQIKPDTTRRENIVIIILESFSYDFIGALTGQKTFTPNFDRIIHKGLLFENAFANGKKSIEALPAIFAGLPALTDNSYISSRYASNALEAMPTVLAQQGYHTSFFHGGRNGTMGFDEFAHIAGIEDYYGLNEYKGPEAFDGSWGIFDEEFLHFYGKKLNEFPQPFMSAVFTLSSHHPYTVPAKHRHLFPANETKLEQSIRYADFALGKFFEEIEKMPWYKNTLFVFTADHTARNESSDLDDESIKAFRIPIVFYHPGNNPLFKGRSKKIIQQTDIMPTIYDYLGISRPFIAFGQSIFTNDTTWAIHYLGGIYTFIKNNTILTFDGEHTLSDHNLENFPQGTPLKTVSPSQTHAMEDQLKAIIQQYQTRLINNRLSIQKK